MGKENYSEKLQFAYCSINLQSLYSAHTRFIIASAQVGPVPYSNLSP
jgi:hypothetical protein